MSTANELLLAIAERHGAPRAGFDQGLSDRMVRLLNSADTALIEKLAAGLAMIEERGFDLGPAAIRRLRKLLTELAGTVPVIGVNYKDAPDKALAFLGELGDPFARIGADATGRTGLDWGIYGLPETFVVGSDGTVLLRFPGPLREISISLVIPRTTSETDK